MKIESKNNMKEVNDWYNRRLAGLVYSGKDSDGDDEWIGTGKMWAKYKELSDKEDRK